MSQVKLHLSFLQLILIGVLFRLMYFGFIITWGFQNLANKWARNVNFFRFGPSNKIKTRRRKHSSNMYTTCLPTVRVVATTRCQQEVGTHPSLVHVWVGYPWTYPLPLDIPTLPQGTYDQRYSPPSPWKDMGPGIPTLYGQNDWQTPVKTFCWTWSK